MSIHGFSILLANNLAKRLNYNEEQAAILRYGFEVIIGEFIKMATILIVAYFLGIFLHVVIALITIGTYRMISGGIHCKTYWQCFITSLVSLLCIGKFAQVFSLHIKLLNFTLFQIIIISSIITFFVVNKWVPVESINRPISLDEKKRFKKISLIWVCIWCMVLSVTVFLFPLDKIQSLLIASVIAEVIQTFSLMPRLKIEKIILRRDNYV